MDKRHSILDDLEDQDEFNFDDVELEGDSAESLDLEEPESSSSLKLKSNDKNNNKVIMICVGAVIICVLLGGFLLWRSKKKNEEVILMQQQQQQTQQNNAQTTTSTTNNSAVDDKAKAGAANLYGSVAGENSSDAVPVTNMTVVQSLQGVDENVNYKVRSSKTVRDFVSYKKHRGVVGSGVEFYWLEGTYKGQTCIIPTSYQIFHQLDEEGQTVVDVEVLTLEDNQEVVTYMSVVQNAKSLINK